MTAHWQVDLVMPSLGVFTYIIQPSETLARYTGDLSHRTLMNQGELL